MNRIIIAIVMLLIAGLICGCEIYSVNGNAKTFIKELDNIGDLLSLEKFDEAGNLSENTLKSWKSVTEHLDKYLYHDYIDSITQGMSSLPVYIKSSDACGAKAQIEEIKIQLTSLKESELPYIHNIL